jgi:hypothetical protein
MDVVYAYGKLERLKAFARDVALARLPPWQDSSGFLAPEGDGFRAGFEATPHGDLAASHAAECGRAALSLRPWMRPDIAQAIEPSQGNPAAAWLIVIACIAETTPCYPHRTREAAGGLELPGFLRQTAEAIGLLQGLLPGLIAAQEPPATAPEPSVVSPEAKPPAVAETPPPRRRKSISGDEWEGRLISLRDEISAKASDKPAALAELEAMSPAEVLDELARHHLHDGDPSSRNADRKAVERAISEHRKAGRWGVASPLPKPDDGDEGNDSRPAHAEHGDETPAGSDGDADEVRESIADEAENGRAAQLDAIQRDASFGRTRLSKPLEETLAESRSSQACRVAGCVNPAAPGKSKCPQCLSGELPARRAPLEKHVRLQVEQFYARHPDCSADPSTSWKPAPADDGDE